MGELRSLIPIFLKHITVGTFLSLTFNGVALAEDSPFTCGTVTENGATFIACDVREDAVALSEVSLNRGRCNSPRKLADGVADRILTYIQQRPTTEEQLASAAMVVSMMGGILELMNSQQIAGIANGSIDIAEINDPKQPDLPLQIGVYLISTNVYKNYTFGNTVAIPISDCNLLEYTLTLNGTEYTWKN
jgi:hypothetical protein